MNKDDIQENLIEIGRKIVQEKGPEFLTARKLSDASGYSVGTIYNQFGNMDNFVLVQNYLTLDALYHRFLEIEAKNSYEKLNAYVHVFSNFVLQNKFLWHMLFQFHLNSTERNFSVTYLRRISVMLMLLETNLKELFPELNIQKRHAFTEALWVSLFSLSSLLTTSAIESYIKMEPTKICELMLNTYLAGMKVSERLK